MRRGEPYAATQVSLWRAKKPLHGIVNSFGLNESSFCVMPTSKKSVGGGAG